jgi:NAD(P)-dependent dehydrogenase (short-subunit alcohol dehydrogenase family)
MTPNDAIYPSLRGRSVLITGGATGIGASLVMHFAAQGANVAFLDIADEAGEALVARVIEAGYPIPWYGCCDLRDIAALRVAVAAGAEAVGDFTVLVNNAAHDQRHAWAEVTPEYWDERQAVNLRHQFFAIQAVAPMMIAAGFGSILNFGSVSWRNGQGGMPAYTTAKAAIEGLTRGMARDLGPHRIRVNCVIPGWVMTERQLALWVTADSDAEFARNQCLPDRLMPDDLARMALWLAADDSRMCTSQCWVVDGGWS